MNRKNYFILIGICLPLELFSSQSKSAQNELNNSKSTQAELAELLKETEELLGPMPSDVNRYVFHQITQGEDRCFLQIRDPEYEHLSKEQKLIKQLRIFQRILKAQLPPAAKRREF